MTHFSLSHVTKRSLVILAAALAVLVVGWLAPMAWTSQERPPPLPKMDLAPGAVRG